MKHKFASILQKERAKTFFAIFILFCVTASIFSYTVYIRRPWFGQLSEGHHQWNSGVAILFSGNWYHEGLWNLRLQNVYIPASVETPTLAQRQIYLSFPLGSLLPIYGLSRIIHHEPTAPLIMAYNLLNHFFIAFFLALSVFLFLRKLKFNHLNSFTLSLIPILLELLLPAPLYWHQNVYYLDQAVILPFILFVFIEILKGDIAKKKYRKIIGLLQTVILIYGVMTDWLFLFIAAVVFGKRILLHELGDKFFAVLKQGARYWLAVFLGLLPFLFQIYFANTILAAGTGKNKFLAFDAIINRFLFRAGLDVEGHVSNFNWQFWDNYMPSGFGQKSSTILWLSLIFFLIVFFGYLIAKYKKRAVKPEVVQLLSFFGMLILPCIFYTYVFRNFSFIHDYTILKFAVPFSIVPFILMPILLFYIFSPFKHPQEIKITFGKIKISFLSVAVCLLIGVTLYSLSVHKNFKDQFPPINPYFKSVGDFIKNNTEYNDIIFSPYYEIPTLPPQQLAYSQKHIYQANSIFDIYDKIRDLKENFFINIFLLEKNVNSDYYGIKYLISVAATVKNENNYYLYKIKKNDFFEIYPALEKDFPAFIDNEINSKTNLFELYDIKNRYAKKISEETIKKIDQKIESEYKNKDSKYDRPEVALADFEIEKLAPERFKFNFLFLVKEKTAGQWNVYFHAVPKEKMKPNFAAIPMSDYFNWDFGPFSITEKHDNNFFIVNREVMAKEQAYYLILGFYQPDSGKYGPEFDLGLINLK